MCMELNKWWNAFLIRDGLDHISKCLFESEPNSGTEKVFWSLVPWFHDKHGLAVKSSFSLPFSLFCYLFSVTCADSVTLFMWPGSQLDHKTDFWPKNSHKKDFFFFCISLLFVCLKAVGKLTNCSPDWSHKHNCRLEDAGFDQAPEDRNSLIRSSHQRLHSENMT